MPSFCPCGAQANYGFNGVRQFCTKCKQPGMKHASMPYCEQNCGTIACFGFKGGSPQFCDRHKQKGMENIVSKRCLECHRVASFCRPEETTSLYCRKHAKPGMICRPGMLRKRRAQKSAPKRQVYYTGVQLNPDGTVKSWGTKVVGHN